MVFYHSVSPPPIYVYVLRIHCNLTFAGTCSIITLVFIAYDRYHVIVFGIAHAKQRITTKKAALIIAFIWTYSVVTAIPPFLGWGGYKLGIIVIVLTLFQLSIFLFKKSDFDIAP